MTLSRTAKDAFVSMFLNALDERDPTIFIEHLDGEDCVSAHKVLVAVDNVLKKRWELMGEPVGEGFEA